MIEILIFSFVGFLILGVPIAIALGAASTLAIYFGSNIPLLVVAQKMFQGLNNFSFLAIPLSLDESARIDGANDYTILFRIVIPLSKAVIAVMVLYYGVGHWNSWFDTMLYNRISSNLTTLQYELMKLLSSVTNQGQSVESMKNAAGTVTPASVRAAATILTILPIVCLYPFLQKYFVTGLTMGGIKE